MPTKPRHLMGREVDLTRKLLNGFKLNEAEFATLAK